jgi:hypothetical protein
MANDQVLELMALEMSQVQRSGERRQSNGTLPDDFFDRRTGGERRAA